MSGGSQALLNHSMISSNTILDVPNPIARTPEKTRNIDAKTRSDGGVNPDHITTGLHSDSRVDRALNILASKDEPDLRIWDRHGVNTTARMKQEMQPRIQIRDPRIATLLSRKDGAVRVAGSGENWM